jgi:hypothetical protein
VLLAGFSRAETLSLSEAGNVGRPLLHDKGSDRAPFLKRLRCPMDGTVVERMSI